MPRIGEILHFREDLFFEGAVQLDWFYDVEKGPPAANAFVFHGPTYFGVGSEEVGAKPNQLVDTCSFTKLLNDRLYGDVDDFNPFVMAIAGYGAGKSHLALALATLFSGHDPATSRQIVANITRADANIGKAIENSISKPNLVIALNGMRDFNLNYEVLNAARKSLALHNQDDSALRALTKAHEIAAHFLERNFQRLHSEFMAEAAERFPNISPSDLFRVLKESLLTNGDAFEVINQVYFQENGSYIRWEDGISAADILTRLSEDLCGEHGYFNQVLVVFDEFGRFIEFASDFPASAGESALQQIFEAVQNSQGNIVMVGFIQSDLRSYLARVARSSNIIRYVSRYEAAEKVYLSSNLETIFAHLIERKDNDAFEHFIRSHHERHRNRWDAFHSRFRTWLPTASQKSVWGEPERFNKTIVEGTYPLHPLTTWMLTMLSEWLQQRSALTFVHESFSNFRDVYVEPFGDLPYIRPIRIVQSDFFRELLLAEEQGRQQSDLCRQYTSILRKHSHRMSDNDRAVLAANVIARIGRFRTQSREDAELLFADCTGLSREEISTSLAFLEDELGVLSFDPHSGSFDFIEDAIGAADFKRLMDRKRRATTVNLSLIFDGEIRQTLGIDEPQQSTYGDLHYIQTQEWDYVQEVVWCNDLSEERLKMYVRDWKLATTPDKPKGRVVWVYVPPNSPSNVYNDIVARVSKNGLFETPTVFMLLDDRSGQLYNSLIDWQAIRSLSDDERSRFERFVPTHLEKTATGIREAFERLQRERLQVTLNGITSVAPTKSLRHIVSDAFSRIYSHPIPFMFDGFRAKNLTTAKKNLTYLARNLCSDLISYQWFHAQNSQIRNRIAAALVTGRPGSWGILDSHCNLVPPSNPAILAIFEQLDTLLDDDCNDGVDLGDVLDRLTAPPYGANDYSAALLLATYFVSRKSTVRLALEKERCRLSTWAEKAFPDRGLDLRVLRATTIYRINIEGARNELLTICNAIEANTALKKWGELLQRLDSFIQQEEVPEELEGKVKACRLIASRGQEIWEQYETFVREQIVHLNRAKENGDVARALEVMQRCEKHLMDAQSLDRYNYGPSERKVIQQMIDVADDVIHNNFERWTNGLQCTNYAQFSGFSAFIENQAKTLRQLSYEDYARRLQTHLKRIEENMHEIKLLQTIRETTDRFIQICKPTQYTSYDQLVAWQQEGERLIPYIRKSLSGVLAGRLIDDVNTLLGEVRRYLEAYHEQISEVLDAAVVLLNRSDCQTLLNKARSLLDRSLRPQDADDIREIADKLTDLLHDLETLDRVKEDPSLVERRLVELRDKWEKVECISALPVLDSAYNVLQEGWKVLEAKWIDQYLSVSLLEISTWNAEQCTQLLKAFQSPPPYLTPESRERLQKLSSAIERRLEDIPVERAVAAYNSLNEKQKRQFLAIITGGR